MSRRFLFALLVAAPVSAADFQLNGHTFTVPEGFEIELAAGPPLTNRPITADFDELGRLYITESSGTNDKAVKQLEDKPHRVLRLEDTDGDGRFDKSSVFADKLMFPEGSLWYDGSLYVAAPPSIWKLTDTDGDGVADRREEWFAGKTLTGCANDLHGPYLGRDGWIYWCKGAFAEQKYTLPNGKPFVTKASHIFRCRPDGTGIEPVMTGGMDNPVDVVFTQCGERIFTTTFFQHPGGGCRDGLIHAVYGGVYGKQHDVVESHKRTGELLPVLTHLGPAAPCGLATYDSQVFGPEFQGNVFACNFNLRKLTRHVLEPVGATFRTQDSDFVVSNNFDFHPTDVLEDADGSLLIVDTGGWYKLCCPTSQLWKPDVLGAIYRVKRTGAKRPDDPRGIKLTWPSLNNAALTQLLSDPRPAVQQRALHELGKRGRDAVPDIAASRSANAVWALTRIDDPSARDAVRARLLDSQRIVREAALHSVSLWRDTAAQASLRKLLTCPSLPTRRLAAEALGRIGGGPEVVTALLDAAERRPKSDSPDADRMLEHALTYALIEIGDVATTRSAGLAGTNPGRLRSALFALDQMDGGGLTVAEIASRIASSEPLVRETTSWIVGRHPELGDVLAGHFRTQLASPDLSESAQRELAQQLARFARTAAIQELLAKTAGDSAAPKSSRIAALLAMRDAGLKETPKPWLAALTTSLGQSDFDLVQQAVLTIRSLPPPKEAGELWSALQNLGANRDTLALVRLDALAAIPAGLPSVDAELFGFLRTNLSPDNFVGARAAAADVLSKAKLTAEQLDALTDSLGGVGPLEIDRLLKAFEQSTDEKLGLKFVAKLETSRTLTALRPDALTQHLAKYPATVRERARPLYTAMKVDLDAQRRQLDETLASLPPGDIRRGQSIFNSPKAACAVCHQFGYVGGGVGPDLTRIGAVRQERDLLESILFPSASFVRSFEPLTVVTTDGRIHNGLVRKDAPDELILATGPREVVRIARQDIDELRPGTVSVMPAGLDQQLSREQLADLLAFLKAAK